MKSPNNCFDLTLLLSRNLLVASLGKFRANIRNAGQEEYWIVEPENKILSVFILQDNERYGRPDIYTQDDKVKVSIFEDLVIDLKTVLI